MHDLHTLRVNLTGKSDTSSIFVTVFPLHSLLKPALLIVPLLLGSGSMSLPGHFSKDVILGSQGPLVKENVTNVSPGRMKCRKTS